MQPKPIPPTTTMTDTAVAADKSVRSFWHGLDALIASQAHDDDVALRSPPPPLPSLPSLTSSGPTPRTPPPPPPSTSQQQPAMFSSVSTGVGVGVVPSAASQVSMSDIVCRYLNVSALFVLVFLLLGVQMWRLLKLVSTPPQRQGAQVHQSDSIAPTSVRRARATLRTEQHERGRCATHAINQLFLNHTSHICTVRHHHHHHHHHHHSRAAFVPFCSTRATCSRSSTRRSSSIASRPSSISPSSSRSK